MFQLAFPGGPAVGTLGSRAGPWFRTWTGDGCLLLSDRDLNSNAEELVAQQLRLDAVSLVNDARDVIHPDGLDLFDQEIHGGQVRQRFGFGLLADRERVEVDNAVVVVAQEVVDEFRGL